MIENLIFPIDHIIIVIGSILVIFCFWRGIISSILGLLTWIGSILITIYFYTDLSEFINKQLLNIDLFNNYEQITNIISILFSIPFIFFSLLIKSLRIFFVFTFSVIWPLKILSTVSKLIFLILMFNVFEISFVI